MERKEKFEIWHLAYSYLGFSKMQTVSLARETVAEGMMGNLSIVVLGGK